jgi:hypothetical protein
MRVYGSEYTGLQCTNSRGEFLAFARRYLDDGVPRSFDGETINQHSLIVAALEPDEDVLQQLKEFATTNA